MPDDDYALLIAFDEMAQIKWVKYSSSDTVYTKPTGTFRKEPLEDIDLLGTETLDILRFRDRKTEKIALCVHWYCNRYC